MGTKTSTDKRSFVMYHDQYEIIKELSDEQIGRLMRAVFEYSESSKEPELDPLMMALFRAFRITIDRDLEKYRDMCRKRADAGRKGGKQTQANATKRVANQADSESDSESVSESDSETTSNTEDKPPAEKEEDLPIKAKEPARKDIVAQQHHLSPIFDAFWNQYPKKQGKATAKKAFIKALKKVDCEEMMEALRKQSASHDWTKDGGQYIPMASTWLNQERWEDEVYDNKPKPAPLTARQRKELGLD